MIATSKFKEQAATIPSQSDGQSELPITSKRQDSLSGDVERAQSEIPLDAVDRMKSALSTWEEVVADNIINQAELARLRELADGNPRNDIYQSFLEHIANSVQKQFRLTGRSVFFRLKKKEETIGAGTSTKLLTLGELFASFGKATSKLEAAEEIDRFKEMKAMVNSGQASVATLLVDASRFKSSEIIKAVLVLMASICRSPLDSKLLLAFCKDLTNKREHRDKCLSQEDLVWAFSETCHRNVPLDTLLLAQGMTSVPWSPKKDARNSSDWFPGFGPVLIAEHRKMREGDWEKLAAFTRDLNIDGLESQQRETVAHFVTLMLSKRVPLDAAIKAVPLNREGKIGSMLHEPISQCLQDPERYPNALQEYAKIAGVIPHEVHRWISEILAASETPTDALLDLYDAMQRDGDDKRQEVACGAMYYLLVERRGLSAARIDRAVEIASRGTLSEAQARLQDMIDDEDLSPKALEKVSQQLEEITRKLKAEEKRKEAETPADVLLDRYDFEQKIGSDKVQRVAFGAMALLLERKNLSAANIDRAIEITSRGQLSEVQARLQDMIDEGELSPKLWKKSRSTSRKSPRS